MAELSDELQSALGHAYTIERELGGGAMSRVFVALERSLNRRVVVKVLPPNLAGGVNFDRFKREIQVAAQLQHAHIVPVLTAGEMNGVPYFTMPFVEGESLRQRIVRDGALPITEAVSILRDVAKALAYAHEHRVVHRDIKPDNVMLSGGSAVVTDFGIAKAISAARTDGGSDTLTEIGTTLGTPAYMAPEQAAADPATDHRADLYAFGCTAFEVLAGRPPFVARSPQKLLAAHMGEAAEPIGILRGDTPAALAALVMHCLEKDPADRPASATDVVRQLDTVTGGAGDKSEPALPRGLPRIRWLRTSRGAVATIGVMVILVLGYLFSRASGVGPFGSLIGRGALAQNDGLIVADFQVAGADSGLGSVVTEGIRSTLERSRIVNVMTASQVAGALERMTRAADSRVDEQLAREIARRQGLKAVLNGKVTPLGAGYVITARLVTPSSGDVLTSVQETAKSELDIIAAIDRVVRTLRGRIGESLRLVNSEPALAHATTSSLEALRKYTSAAHANSVEGDFVKAARLAEEAVAIDSTFAMAYRTLWFALINAELNPGRAAEACDLMFQYRERLPEMERLSVEAEYFRAGPRRDRARAIALFESLVERFPPRGGSGSQWGNAYASRRQYTVAESLFSQNVRADSSQQMSMFGLIAVQQTLGKSAEARATLDRARRNLRVAPARIDLAEGNMSYAEGKFAAADTFFRRATIGSPPQFAADGYLGLAALARRRGQLALWAQYVASARRTDQSRGSSPDAAIDLLTVIRNDIHIRDKPVDALRRLDSASLRGSLPLRIELYALAGKPQRANELFAELEAIPRDSARSRIHANVRDRALGWIAYAEGRFLDAIAAFRRGDMLPDGPAGSCPICLDPDIGRAFEGAGQPDSAIAAYEHFIATPYNSRRSEDGLHLAWITRRLAALQEAKGNRAGAAEYYRKFIDLWKDADQELQPQVADARRKLLRLESAPK